jgi:ubiquinone/menaquinone biosynthesis C-methylase UbiE
MQKSNMDLFNTIAIDYDNPAQRYTTFCADRIILGLKPKPSTKILDIATGTANVAIGLAQTIGNQGRVTAIDLADNMLDKAYEKIQHLTCTNIDLHNMNAQDLDFKSNYFDYITCSLAMPFIDNHVKTLTEWRRVAKLNAKIVFTTFTNKTMHSLLNIFYQDLAKYNITYEDSIWQSQQNLANNQYCLDITEQANLRDVKIHTRQLGYHLLYIKNWWELILSSSLFRFLINIPATELQEFKQQHFANIQHLVTNDGLWLDMEINFIFCKK